MTELPAPTLEQLDAEANIRRIAREVAREELTLHAGAVLRLTEEADERDDMVARRLAEIWADVLSDYLKGTT